MMREDHCLRQCVATLLTNLDKKWLNLPQGKIVIRFVKKQQSLTGGHVDETIQDYK